MADHGASARSLARDDDAHRLEQDAEVEPEAALLDVAPIEPDSLLGTPQSHGCIRMKQSEAELVWNWSEVGTTVVVTDLGY